MTELAVFGAAAVLVVFVLIKGYTTNALTQMRQEGGRLHAEEARTRQEVEQAKVLQESAEALHTQASFDCEKFTEELADMARQIAVVEADLGRSEEAEAEE